jgi:hypothetical protein
MPTPWTFGWTQLLTTIGFVITIEREGIAPSTSRWERVKIVAYDAWSRLI